MDADERNRRLVHLSGAGFPILYLLNLVVWQEFQLIYLGGTILAIILEGLRLKVGVEHRIFRELTREYEETNLAGYAIYVFGSAIVVFVFAPKVAIPALLILAIADPISGLLSSGESQAVKHPVVMSVTFLVSAIIALQFVPLLPSILGALAATTADGVKLVVSGYVIDDNLTIPIGSAIAIWIGLQWLPII